MTYNKFYTNTVTGVPSDCNDNVDWQTIRQDYPDNHWLEDVVNCN